MCGQLKFVFYAGWLSKPPHYVILHASFWLLYEDVTDELIEGP